MDKIPDLFAWMGEDELGSGDVGIKQGFTPCGLIPLVSVDVNKIAQPLIANQMQTQSKAYKKTIRLIRFVAQEVVITVEP
ncbi:MAG: hypothetical protein M0R80_01200 [Proteobacteria bacterium]|jgi:hypothetical protein|nr:hypothetical protein [Pseudomonadota bacterium]